MICINFAKRKFLYRYFYGGNVAGFETVDPIQRTRKDFVMTKWRYSGALLRAAAYIAVFAGGFWAFEASAQQAASFKEDVFPIIEIRCLECHVPGGAGYEASGLDLRTYEGLMKGTNHGPVVVPRSAFESNLIAVIDHRTAAEIRMPHDAKKLSKCERFAFRTWINQGARNN